MKIGIWADEYHDKQSGGSYTYCNALINGIDGFTFNAGIEIVFITNTNQTQFNKPALNYKPHQKDISTASKVLRRLLKLTSRNIFGNWIDAIDQREKLKQDRSVTAWLKANGIKMMFYPTPGCHVISGIPYLLNNWDLAHHSTYAFPEFSENGNFHTRNKWYTEIMTGALMTFCETEAGKQELVRFLDIPDFKFAVMPMFASDQLIKLQVVDNEQANILKQWQLNKDQFFFYPAQFWAHKNHYNLIQGFKLFVKQQPHYKLVLCGSDKGNIDYLKAVTKDAGLEDKIIFTGFVADEVLYAFYKNAAAMVMPTFLGPSNIPPIEALFLNCPVLLSDLPGHREIMKDAALYFDPADADAIKLAMLTVVDQQVRQSLINAQKALAMTTPHTITRSLVKFEEGLLKAIQIRNCWE